MSSTSANSRTCRRPTARPCWSCGSEKNCNPCWARTRSDRDDPSGTAGRRHHRLDQQAVPVVRRAAPQRVLQAGEGRTETAGQVGRSGQGHDRGESSFGYRTGAHLLGFNKNTVQRIFQPKGWQVRKRPVDFRPRIQSLPSVAKAPNERWATDMCRVWAGRDGWTPMALVIDCHSRELLGWHLSRSGKSKTAESALEQALIARFGTLGRVQAPFLRLGLHQSPLHGAGQELRPAPGVHHAAQPRAERPGRAGNPHAQGAMRASTSIRIVAARQPGDRGLDPFLQPPAPASVTKHEDSG